MKVVALISGGKDSCFNMMHCVAEGHEIVALANLRPKDTDELDSFMYQTVGHHAIELYADALGVPLFRGTIHGTAVQQDKTYQCTEGDEVEDLYQLLQTVKKAVAIDAVSSGAILSDYQRSRVEHVCLRLGLTSLAYLWRRDQFELIEEMISCHLDAIIIKVAALGLTPDKFLGKSLASVQGSLKHLVNLYGLNPCGEGGEYETFCLDCPLFKKRIVIDNMEIVMHSDDSIAPVAYINLKSTHLQDKDSESSVTQFDRLKSIAMKTSLDFVKEVMEGASEGSAPEPLIYSEVKARLEQMKFEQFKMQADGWFAIAIPAFQDDCRPVEDQVFNLLTNINDVLKKNRLKLADVISVNLYISNMNDFPSINGSYKKFFDINPPVRACIQAPLPANVIMQIDCIGKCSSTDNPSDQLMPTERMHVQSISHWAPANIGPYSQSARYGQLVFVAGQIGLVPGNMTLVQGGLRPQCTLTLRHVNRILLAVGDRVSTIVLAMCYVTCHTAVEFVRQAWTEFYQHSQFQAQSELPLLVFVTVPALPRGALVEWQIYATSCPDAHIDVLRGAKEQGAIGLSCVSRWLSQSYPPWCSLVCRAVLSDVDSPVDHHELAQNMLLCITSTLSKRPESFTALHLLRIFYKCSIIDINSLRTGFLAIVEAQGCELNNCQFSFVPVNGFEELNCVLIVVQ